MTMPASDKLLQRIALIADLIGKAPAGFGRTALMKCMYFLQTVRRVPLGYHFRLYTYGPFDSDVLSDLSLAERHGLVESRLSQFSGGYRYELQGGEHPRHVFEGARDFLDRYEDDIDWVIRVFGGRSARDLENASTLVFIDRSVAGKGDRITLGELARKVHDVKPHLAMPLIEEEARSLREQGLFEATP
jgi:hypothetical protein